MRAFLTGVVVQGCEVEGRERWRRHRETIEGKGRVNANGYAMFLGKL